MTSVQTIRTSVYNTLYNHLQTGTYALTTDNIYPSYNDVQMAQSGYPQVIISPITVAFDKLTLGGQGIYEVPITVVIEARHNSAANARTQADEITYKILNGLSVLSAAGIKKVQFEGDSYDRTSWTQNKSDHKYMIVFTAIVRGSLTE